ncbi:MAG TPA: 6-carboxytetrahydropterin synthase QueD [Oculatellaceae cyanobacterium]
MLYTKATARGNCLQPSRVERIVYEIGKDLYFSYGHRLMNHAGKCKLLHGHNAKVTIKVASEYLDQDGMVMDFSDLKTLVKSFLDEQFDHQMLLHKDDPAVPVLQSIGEPLRLLDVHPTAECLAKLIFDHILENNIRPLEVILWETESCFASYRADP